MTDPSTTASGTSSVAISGNVSQSAIFTGDVLFQLFARTSSDLAHHILIESFRDLVEERTRNFVGREFVINAIDGLLKDREFPWGYIVIRGEPGIGKTALMAQLVKLQGHVHHFNSSLRNIRTA